MQDPDLELAFARFRRQGDAAALGEVFDGVAPELLRLARHLVGDAGEAEDLVQSTFVTAIERAAEFDEERALVPWLVGILAKHAANARRARRARPGGDALEPRDVRPGPAEHAEGRELRAVLARALAELPETYRAIVARFLDGHAPREIARETGLTDGAARVRVHRGLAALRRALPVGVASGAAVVLTGGRGLADVRAHVLATARAAGPALATSEIGAGVAGGVVGGVLMKKLVLGAVAALLALVFLWRGSDPGRGAAPEEPQPSVAEAGYVPATPLAPIPTGASRAELPADATGTAELVHALGRVVEYLSGEPVVGARVWSTPAGAEGRVARATVAADGSVEFELPRAELETLFVEADGFAPVAVPATSVRRARFWEEAGREESEDGKTVQLFELRLQRGFPLEGRVVDERGRGIEGARLGLLADLVGLAVVEERCVGRSGSGGVIESDGLLPPARAGQRWLLYAVHEQGFGSVHLGRAEEGDSGPVELVLAPRREVRLRVLEADDRPVEGAWVALFPLLAPFFAPEDFLSQAFLPLPPLLEGLLAGHTDAQGTVRLRVPGPPSALDVGVQRYLADVWRDGINVAREPLRLRDEGVLRLPPAGGRELSGRVLSRAGLPVEGAEVRIEGRRSGRTRSASDGSFRLALTPADGFHPRLEAEHEGQRAMRMVDLEFGRPDGHELVLREPRSIRGVARDEQGQPCPGLSVFPRSLEGVHFALHDPVTDEQGRFALEGLFEGEFELTLAGGEPGLDLARFVPVRARGGDTDVELLVPRRREEPCRLVVRARRAQGDRVELRRATVQSQPRAGAAPTFALAEVEGGVATFADLAPGRYEVWGETPFGSAGALCELAQAGESVELELVVEERAALRVQLVLGGLARPERLYVTGQALTASGTVPGQIAGLMAFRTVEAETRELLLEGLCPGRWTFRYHGEGLSPLAREVELVPGRETELTLVAAPGALLQLDLSAWAGMPAVRFETRDAQGRLLSREWLDPARVGVRVTVAPEAVGWHASSPPRTGESEGVLALEPAEERTLFVPAPGG